MEERNATPLRRVGEGRVRESKEFGTADGSVMLTAQSGGGPMRPLALRR